MHAHEHIDPRRGPGRERDDGRREIDAGVSEYEEDRNARDERKAIEDDSAYDLDFDLAVMAERDEQRGAIPACDEGLERERQAMNVYDMVRSVFFPDSHVKAMKLALEILEGAAKLPAEPDGLEDMIQGKITLLKEVWRRPTNTLTGGGKVTVRQMKAAPTRPPCKGVAP